MATTTAPGRSAAPADDAAPPDSLSLWQAAPAEAHRLWRERMTLTDRAYAEQSTAQYRSLFRRFCEWMARNRLNLRTIGPADIGRFLDALEGRGGAKASTRTQRMYLAEIDRVMHRLVELGLRRTRATEPLMDQVRITARLKPRSIALPDDDAHAKIRAHIEAVLGRSQEEDVLVQRELMAAAMATLVLEGGLTSKELQKLRLKSLRPSAGERLDRVTLRAPGHRLLQDRDVDLRGWAAACVVRWWQLRSALVLQHLPAGARMRPASAKAFALTPEGPAITVRSIYNAVSEVCAQAGVGEEVGPQQLRNLFMASLLSQEVPDEELRARAGLLALDQVRHMRIAAGVRPGPRTIAAPG